MVTSLVVLSTAVAVLADAVIMYNNQRYEGQVVEETEDEVWLRQNRPDGVAFIRKIHKFNISRVERGGVPGSRPASAPADVEEQTPSAPPVQPDAERLKQLDSVISKYQQKNYDWAGFLASQLINKSSPGELAYMSAEVEKRAKISLAELAAESHFKAAEPARPGQRVHLPYVTDYERPAILKLLRRAHEEALGRSIEAPDQQVSETENQQTPRKRQQPQEAISYMIVDQTPKGSRDAGDPPISPKSDAPVPAPGAGRSEPSAQPPTTAPTPAGAPSADRADRAAAADGGAGSLKPTSAQSPTLRPTRTAASRPAAWPAQRSTAAIDWLDRPEEYDGTPAEAEALINHIQYTTSLLGERIRLDRKVQNDPALKTSLIQERERLGLLLRAAKAQAKGGLTQKERAAILAERKRLTESHRKEVVPREKLIEDFVRQGRKDGPPPGKYPTTSGSGNVELIPVDINTP